MMDGVIAQAITRWFPTATAPVRAQGMACGICGIQSGIEDSFLRVLPFPLSLIHLLIAPKS